MSKTTSQKPSEQPGASPSCAEATGSEIPENAAVQVLVYEERLTHSVWQDFFGEDHWGLAETMAYLRQAVKDRKYVGWRLLTIHKQVIGDDSPNTKVTQIHSEDGASNPPIA